MANLCFQRIQPGPKAVGNEPGSATDVYFNPFTLPGLVENKAALLLMEIRHIQFGHNFVSMNHKDKIDKPTLNDSTTGDAAGVLEENFVDRILPSGGIRIRR